MEAGKAAGDDQGGLLEDDWHRPDESVLGTWIQGEELPEGHEADYAKPPEGNPAWMQEMGSVFVAGAMHAEGMVEKWKAMGASQEVLKWVREGGYTIKVSDEGRGIFKRNGKTARLHNTELVTLVIELLMKETWEVVRRDQLYNLIPLNLAPKPSKVPPWRIITDAREVNEHIAPWKFRYETLKSVPLLLNKGDWMLTMDLEDAYYSCLLTEDSRNLFGAKVSMGKEQWQQLKEKGLVPEDLEHTVESDVYIRPRGLPMGFRGSS